MKKSFCYTSLLYLLSSSILGVHIGVYDEIPTSLCDALNSILELNVLMPPLSIQLSDLSFDQCIDTRNASILMNLVANNTRLISESSVVIVETKADLPKNLTSLMNFNSNHLIVVRRYTSGDLDQLVYQFWKKLLLNVSFLTTDASSNVFIQTFTPYNEEHCNDTMLRTINIFSVETRSWHNTNFFPKKLNNFYGCAIRIATHKNVIPYIVREEIVNGQRVLKGRVIQMVDALSISLNFTADLDYAPSVAAFDDCYQKVRNNEADLFIGNVAIDKARTETLDFSLPIFFEFLKFAVPPGKSYTQLENFLRVFDSVTWIFILMVFLLIGGTVLIISCHSKKVNVYAFGVRYRNAFMDFLATIFGSSLSVSPNAILPRLILVKFVLFCFVMRSIYQGSLYNFLQSGGKAKSVQSIDEMVSQGFTFFMLKGYANYLDLSSQNYASKQVVTLNDFDRILEKISDSNFKGSLMHTASLIEYKNSLESRIHNQSILCREYLMTVAMVAYLRKNFYLTEIVNEKIGLFHAAGLINFWDRRSKTAVVRRVNLYDEQQPISLKNLEGMFIVFLYACGASVMCFFAEIILHFVK